MPALLLLRGLNTILNPRKVLMTVPGTRRSTATAAVINIIIIINYISHSRIFSNIMTGSREFT